MDVTLVFKGVGIAKCIGEYLGIVESINSKIDRLSQSEFEAGIRALNQAGKSSSEQKVLLREARSRLNKAISLETNERLALAYLGLSLCHYHLKDYSNAKDALQDLLNIEFKYPIKSSAKSLADSMPFFEFFLRPNSGNIIGFASTVEDRLLESSKKKLKKLQESL
jgi:tetratricopeptide (TPR) repeat protein